MKKENCVNWNTNKESDYSKGLLSDILGVVTVVWLCF
jgi:hypothetical protein